MSNGNSKKNNDEIRNESSNKENAEKPDKDPEKAPQADTTERTEGGHLSVMPRAQASSRHAEPKARSAVGSASAEGYIELM